MKGFPKIGPRSKTSEKARASLLLGDFVAQGSRGEKYLQNLFGKKDITRSALISLATVFSCLIDVPFERDLKRKKELIVKWFDNNLDQILKWHPYIHFELTEYGAFQNTPITLNQLT